MKEKYTDPETGWAVSRETRKNTEGTEIVDESITDPKTNITYERVRVSSYEGKDIQTWVQDISRDRVNAKREDDELAEAMKKIYPELASRAKVPNGPLGRIKLHFAQTFARWEIFLPENVVANRQRGKFVQEGWAIWFLFGADENGEYFDYYSSHRMTEDSHERIYEDGRTEYLDAIIGMHQTSLDPQEAARLDAEHLAENQRISAILEAKGFGIDGDEPMSVLVNRHLRVWETEE